MLTLLKKRCPFNFCSFFPPYWYFWTHKLCFRKRTCLCYMHKYKEAQIPLFSDQLLYKYLHWSSCQYRGPIWVLNNTVIIQFLQLLLKQHLFSSDVPHFFSHSTLCFPHTNRWLMVEINGTRPDPVCPFSTFPHSDGSSEARNRTRREGERQGNSFYF